MTATTSDTETGAAVATEPGGGSPLPPPSRAARAAFRALVVRDLIVLRKNLREFVLRTVMQPLMLVFLLTYVFPELGQAAMGMTVASESARTVVVGIVALSIVMQGIQSVSLPLVTEFGFTREIDDRVMAPIPVSLVALQKIASGAVHSLVAGLIVLPLAALVPVVPIRLDVDWPVLLTVGPLVCFVAGAGGLVFGVFFDLRSVGLLSLVLLPLTFLGAVFFSWDALEAIPWLQQAVLVNPVVYMSEGLRAALAADGEHLPLPVVYGALVVSACALTALGLRGFAKRVEIGGETPSTKMNRSRWILVGTTVGLVALVAAVVSQGGDEKAAAACRVADAVPDAAYDVALEEPALDRPLRIRATSDGLPVTGAEVCLESVMVGMEEMGLSARAGEVSPGLYEVEPLFPMRGPWKGTVVITPSGGTPVAVPVLFEVT